MERHPVILSIAGSDCSGGAGIQADIKTISALGGYAASAITAITIQNTLGVRAVQSIAPDIVRGQIEAVMDDLQPVAIKIGMVNDIQIVRVISDCLQKYSPAYVVYDPVMVSTSGKKLMTDEAIEEIKKELETNQNLDYQYIILDVPLLFESKLDKLCDYTIGVIAPKTEKIKRICKRDKLSKEKALQRLNSQPNDEFFTKNCNTVINNENKEETIKMVNEIMLKLQ